MPLDDVPLLYTGKKRDRYGRALADVKQQNLSRRDAQCEMFVKADKNDPRAKHNPDPRAITFRNPRYSVVLASYLKPIEHHIYNTCGGGPLLPPGRMIGKGLNQQARADLLREKWCRFRNPVAVVLDASRFDKHCSDKLLRIEHLVYLCSNSSPEFQRLLSWQLRNHVKTRSGFRYVAAGRRMSGDMNTALGNCVLMVVMVCAMARALGISMFDLLDDGDDCVFIVEREDLQRVLDGVHAEFLSYGMQVKVESYTSVFEEISWCQSSPVFAGGRWRMIRNPSKVMSTAISSTKYAEVGARPRLINTVGAAESILNAGVPVLQEYAHALCRNSGTTKLLKLDATDDLFYRVHRELRGEELATRAREPVTQTARLSFARAFGISPGRQQELEDWLGAWSFDIAGGRKLDPFGPDDWPDKLVPTEELHTPGYV